jgi:quercetin dioxygenase-like cupin family protein
MSTNESVQQSCRPGESIPYVVDRFSGRKTNLGGDVFSVPIGGEETDGEFALVETTTTRAEEPITPMHWHENEHDIFMCLRGRLQVWADGESRILGPGDIASVPPGVNHSYRPVGPKNELLGLIDTGGWEEFFYEGGEPYDGPPFAEKTEIDEAKFGQVAKEYGVNLAPQEYPEPDLTATDQSLPGAHEPYVLEAGYGPQYALGGTLATVLCTDAESDGSFGIVSYEGPKGTGLPRHGHDDAATSVYVLEGTVTVELDGTEVTAKSGQYVNVPAGTQFSYTVADNYARLITFTSGDSAHKLPEVAGEPWSENYNPDPDAQIDQAALQTAAEELGINFE